MHPPDNPRYHFSEMYLEYYTIKKTIYFSFRVNIDIKLLVAKSKTERSISKFIISNYEIYNN